MAQYSYNVNVANSANPGNNDGALPNQPWYSLPQQTDTDGSMTNPWQQFSGSPDGQTGQASWILPPGPSSSAIPSSPQQHNPQVFWIGEDAVVSESEDAWHSSTDTDTSSDSGNEEIDMSEFNGICLLYTSPSPRDGLLSRMPSSA